MQKRPTQDLKDEHGGIIVVLVKMMTDYYCKKNHFPEKNLCCDCEKLIEYAWLKLDKCFYGENKPACLKCEIHCYSAPMRKKVKDIMRYSGPRMIYIHPVASIKHLELNRYAVVL